MIISLIKLLYIIKTLADLVYNVYFDYNLNKRRI